MKETASPVFWPGFRATLKQQFLLLTRYPVNLVANFLLVLVMVIVVTLVITLFVPQGMELQFRGITLYGFVIYIFLTHTIWSVGFSIQKEKVQGTLTSLYLTPTSRFSTLLARALVVLSWTAIASAVGLLIAQTFTGPLAFHQPWLALGILVMTVSSFIGLGFAIAGFTLRFGETVELVANVLEFGLMGLCALFFPFSVLPAPLEKATRAIPLSYSVDAFRTVSLGQPQPELLPLKAELVIVALAGLLGPLLGYIIYLINEKSIRRQGTL
jgi:ABC-2 type transport system permease protein